MDRHPFTLLVWNHTWTSLVHLSITADLSLCRVCQMLPPATFAEFPLPHLEVMRLKTNVIFWTRENAAAIVRHISHFYLGSKTLRSLDLRFLVIDPDVLSSLLPSQPAKQFPRLEAFGFKATNTQEQEHLRWIPILTAFIIAHKDTLKVLHVIDVPATTILAPLLFNVQDSISDVRLDIDVDDFHEFKELVHPRSEIARFICRALRCLHIPNTLSYETWDHLVQLFSLSGRTPHLTTLRLSVDLLSFGLLTSLAISFPHLDTLHLKIRQSYSHQNKIAFISQFRKHSPNDPFSSWKLRDISLVHDIDDVRLRREKEIMNEIAALIPSISSFNGSGDMF
ncbi:hypothetical protein DL96DRAFT_911720 [Flagelloscypha sp. PMI_526]|nr:hypothetical protein DL96DRAFT_911720 [Flagelloscypha sp. PMI_526]